MNKIFTIKLFILLFFLSFACFGQNDTSMYIVVTAGQSNMSGRAAITPEDTISYPNVFKLTSDSVWVKAKNPIHYDSPGAGVGPVMTCVKELLKKYGNNIKIGIVPCAVGGTSIENWVNNANVTGVNLHQNLIARAKFASKHGKLIGVIWHQGEQNGAPWVYNDYRNKLKTVLNNIRKDLNEPFLPIVAGELGDFFLSSLYYEYKNYINIDINSLKTGLVNVGIASAKDLLSKGDNLHFNTASQHIFGQRYAQALFPLLKYIKSDSVSTFVKDTFNIDITLKQYIPDSIKKLQFEFKYDTNLVAYNKFIISDSTLLKGDLQINAVNGVIQFQFLSDTALFLNHNKKLIQFSLISLKKGLSSTQFQNVILNDTNFITSVFNNKIFSKADLPSFKFDSINTQVSKKTNVVVKISQLKPHTIKSFNFDFVYDTLKLDFKKVSLINSKINANKIVITTKKGRVNIAWNDSIPIQFANNDSVLKIEYVSINEGVTNPFFDNVFFDSLAMNYNFNSKISSIPYNTYIQSDWVVDYVFKSVSLPINFTQINPLEISSFNFSIHYDSSKVQFQNIFLTDSILGNNGKLSVINDTAGVLKLSWKGDFPLSKMNNFIPFVINFLTINEGLTFANIHNAYIDSFPVTSVSDGAIFVKPYLPVIVFDSIKTSVDKTFKLPFYITQKYPKDLNSFQYTFYYDESKLEYLGYEFRDSLDSRGDVYHYFNNGSIIISWSSNTPIDKSSKIDILDFKFRSKSEGYTYPYIFDPMVNNTTIDSVINTNIYSSQHTTTLSGTNVETFVGKKVKLPVQILQVNPYEIKTVSFDIQFDTLNLLFQNYDIINSTIKNTDNFKLEKKSSGLYTISWFSDTAIAASEIIDFINLNFITLNEGFFDVNISNVKIDDLTNILIKNGFITSKPNLPKIYYQNIQTNLYKSFSVPIFISQQQVKNITQFSFNISYDTLKLKYLNYAFLHDNLLNVNVNKGSISVDWQSQNGFIADSLIDILNLKFSSIDSGYTTLDLKNVLINQNNIDSITEGAIAVSFHAAMFKFDSQINTTVDKQIEIPIYLSQTNPYTVSNFKFVYKFDASKINYLGYRIASDFLNDDSLIVVNQGDSVVLSWSNKLNVIPENELTKLIYLQFSANDSCVVNSYLFTKYIDLLPINLSQNQELIFEYQYGDIDNNTLINTLDASLALNYSVGLKNDTIHWNAYKIKITDVNFSNTITAADASLILQKEKNLINEFVKGEDLNSKIEVQKEGDYFVFKSKGGLFSLNLNFDNDHNLIDLPIDINTNYLFAQNINDTTYKLALASEIAIDSGEVLFKIKHNQLKSAIYTFNLEVNNSVQKVVFDLVLGVSNQNKVDVAEKVKVYPNSTLNKLIIKDYSENSKVKIFNSQGIEIYKSDNLNQAIYLSDLPNGLLIIQVKNDIESITTKVVIQH